MENEKREFSEEEKKAAVMLELVFSAEAVSTYEILDKYGVERSEFARWLSEDGYVSEVRELSSRAGEAEMARIMKCLASVARGGDVRAAKTLRELIGEPGGSAVLGGNGTLIEKFKDLDREILGVDG
ncbi:MAG: hypothetical protein IKM46_06830 [Clostridia bacterium]|nr:hypothetical protein [Clostridia bacterium]